MVISPATTHSPVVSSVSHATRPFGSSARIASRTASDTWSAILSGWPSVTDSEVKVQRLTVAPVRSGWSDRASDAALDDGVEHGAGDGPLVGEGDIVHDAVGRR